ncbi:Lrp/AsnC family transcriptional regulator [Pseudomonadota bacterium]
MKRPKASAKPLPIPASGQAKNSPDEAARLVPRSLLSDPFNRAIIEHLQEDGRMAYSTIARELNSSEGTIRNRVNQMIDAGVFRIVAVADPMALGHAAYSFIGLKLAAGADPRVVAKPFVDREEVLFVLFAAGHYDLLIEVLCRTQEDLRDLILEMCYGQPDIASVEPMMGLEVFKYHLKWDDQQWSTQ